ncbi:MAG: ATP-binding protein [Negativicutes bacterium]|nr:ATP-binding protein [Negativicutes bacterium]MDR3591872.1 ATP-binding protein [Negativicutes bacterium]
MKPTQASSKLNHLIIYRNLLKDPLVQKLQTILTGSAKEDLMYELTAGLIAQAEKLGLRDNLWQSYLVYLIARDENVFSTTVEKNRGKIGTGLKQAVIHDLAILREFLRSDLAACGDITFICDFSPTGTDHYQDFSAFTALLLQPSAELAAEELAGRMIEYYTRYGCGKTAGFAAFRWDEETGLAGIKHLDGIRLEDIVGYEYQKEVLTNNTEAFLANKPANNVLLVGARGTGKSSSVKGLVNRYFANGLRLVEVPKFQLRHLNKIIEALRGRSQKFIVFLDDLSFEEAETEYKHLKSVIEGGVEAKPDNVLIYATSNRRHLIRESWADRADTKGGDIHSADSVQEKISLSDRFGITLTYPAPDQNEYLRIVETLAAQHAVTLPQEELHKRALRWEMSHSGRSGRVAQQFIKHIMANS